MARRRWGHIETVIPGEKHRIFWPIDADPVTGKRRKDSETVYGTYDDADFALAVKRVQLMGADRETTWAQFWEAKVVPSLDGLAPRTRDDYISIFDDQLRPRIGNDIVSETTYKRACSVMAEIEPAYKWQDAYAVWKKICNMAVHEEILSSNPIDRSIPSKKPTPRVAHELMAEDIWRYLLATMGTRYFFLVMLCMVEGMRPEECYAICSWDVRRLGSYVTTDVYKTLTVCKRDAIFREKTKTEFSRRRLFSAEPFASMLEGEIALCDGPLFPGRHPKGAEPNETWFAHPDRVRRNWEGWCKRHGLAYVRPGDMRTIYSDWHGEAMTPDTLVDMSMGHKPPSTRGRNYMTRTRTDMENVADSMARYLMSRARCSNLLLPHRPSDRDALSQDVPQIPKSSQFMARLATDF